MMPLPGPVERYLSVIGAVDYPRIRTAHIRQKGLFRRGSRWLRFTAEQHFTTDPPSFTWRAQMPVFPLLSISVIDQSIDGHGLLQAKLLSIFKVAAASGPETDQGELLRYLVEAAWFPTAFLSPYFEWEGIDAQSAKATLRLPNIAVSAIAHFDGESRLAGFTADRYYIDDQGKMFLRPWSAHFTDYRHTHGLLIPFQGSVTWHLESGDLEYFRVELTHIEYDV